MSNIQKNNRPNVPNLRFPEFSGEWEKRKLASIGKFFSGGTPTSSNKDYYDGEIPFIRSGEIHSDHTELSISAIGYENSSAKMVSKGDLLLALYGATSGDIAISRMSGAINQAILCIRTTQDHLFLKSVWEKHVKNILNTYLQGGQGNLSADIVKNLFFYFPRIEEQRKIGRLIELIDQRIAIQNRIIEKYESLIKAIRLRVFSEILSEYECKQAIIADVLQYEQPAKYIVNSTEYLNDSSLTPVLTANKAFILGYTDETSGIYKKGECIILDDFTLDCKMVDFPFKVKSSAIKILTPRAGMNLRYIYEYLNYLELETTEHKRHYITEIEPMTIAIPEPNIIERIADVFNLLNGRLSCSKELLQTFLLLKRHILHQMFI